MGERLVVASNRGPVSWSRTETGGLGASRGFGGLVTALGGALQQESGTWVSVALSAADRTVAADHPDGPFDVSVDGSSYRLRLLDAGERFDAYYNAVSNRLLWFTLHGLWGEPYEPSGVGWPAAWDSGYVGVNTQIADAVAAEAGSGAEVYLQDYHLCLTARRVRELMPGAGILHYIHTPWASPDYLARLPDRVSQALVQGLLAADVVAFSSPAWSRAFRASAARFAGARISGEVVRHAGGSTVVADFVLGVDEEDLATSAASDAVATARADVEDERGNRKLLLRVDRTDLSKNILRGLLAYELLLDRYPEHRGRVWHYAHLNPSRQSVPEYRDYLKAVEEVAARIQDRFGTDSLTMFVGDDYPRAIAALQRSDVLLTNPVTDGTNLVAKEGAALNERDGVLVISRNAGAADVLGEAAVQVNPYDVEQTATALHQALGMDETERRSRAAHLREAARRGPPEAWFAAQRHLLRATVARSR